MWESILEANDGEAILVSSDKDFLEKGASGKSMARELEAECGGRISLYVTLADALRAIEREAPPADIDRAIESITAAVLPVAREYEEKGGFTLGERRDARVELFATEKPSLTAAIFDVAFQGFDVPVYQQEAAPEAVIRLTGDCMLDDSGEVTDLNMDYINLFSLDGERLPGGIVYLRGIGEPGVVAYSVRVPLGTAPV